MHSSADLCVICGHINTILKPLISFAYALNVLYPLNLCFLVMASFLQRTILFFLLLTGTFAQGQVKFSASVSATQISKNELLQLKLMVENAKDVQQITPPSFKNFIVVSGPNQESGTSIINGDVKSYIALSYVLKPRSAGNFSIAAATAKADGKELRSNSIAIKVNNSLAPNSSAGSNLNSPFPGIDPFDNPYAQTALSDNVLRKGESAEEKINKNMFLKLDLDKTSCYVGEPVIATYKLYTRLRSESNLVKNPSFNGFSVIDLQQPSTSSYTREKINGREYNVYIIRKAQLYPLQSGELELEPAELENNIAFIKEEYLNRQNNLPGNLFGELDESNVPAEGIENRRLTLRSKPVTITVKQLPAANIPASFTGAVGKFSIITALEKNTFSTDDAGKLRLIIKGEGNLQLVNNPEIQWPQDFEAFEPSATDDFIKTNVPVSGRKIIDYPFTVSKPGNYTLPAIKFSYFDAKEGKYKTDSSQPVSFTVTKGTGKKISPAIATRAENVSGLHKFFNNRRLVVSCIAVLILLGLIFWLKRDTKKEIKIAANKIAAEEETLAQQKITAAVAIEEKNWLEKTGALIEGNSSTFYSELNHALKSYLSAKLNLPIETINKKSISEELDKKNITVDTVVQLQQLMNEIELQLYTPFPEREKMQELYNSAADMIQLLETYKDQASVNL
jgi:hypothetical protein